MILLFCLWFSTVRLAHNSKSCYYDAENLSTNWILCELEVEMNSRSLHVCVCIFLVVAAVSVCYAEVEWQIINTLNIDGTPLDVAVSPDGRIIYVLTEDGNIHIYSASGAIQDTVVVGPQIDRIKLGPKGEHLIVSSRKNKTLQIISLNFVHNISSSGSPTKGAKDAAVVISVFSDFQ